MAIYTKTGDKGTTKVFDKKSGQLVGVSKESCQIRSIGVIDELNSYIAVAISGIKKQESRIKEIKNYIKKLQEIQGNLFVINSILAGSKLRFSNAKIRKLERDIDDWEGSLPVLKNFIFYGGSEVSSLLFYARALCRKTERSLVKLSKDSSISPSTIHYLQSTILPYVNRLSDYLFMFARKVNCDLGVKEEYWIGNKKDNIECLITPVLL